MTERPIPEQDLHAYADDRLAPDRRAAVEHWLAANPEAAAEVAGWRAQNAAIRALFAGSAVSDPGDRVLVRRRGARRTWPRVAVAAAFFALG